jgi:GntR family transcriptional regulator, gluconate operon transcriptional repressor
MSDATPVAGGGLRPLDAPRSLAEDAADRIRERILAGGFGQGEHLVEARIAEQLNVSRGPVREAFKLLRAEGLLEEEPRRGTFVVSMSPEDVREIYAVRAAIEGRAARTLAGPVGEEARAELHALLGDLERAVRSGDASSVFARDLAFHEGLCRLSGNRRLVEVFVRYVPTLRALLRLDERVLASLDDVALQHRQLVDAIDRRDPEEAARLAEEHVDHAAELVGDYLARAVG